LPTSAACGLIPGVTISFNALPAPGKDLSDGLKVGSAEARLPNVAAVGCCSTSACNC